MNILFLTASKSETELTSINKLLYKIFKTNIQPLTFPILGSLTPKDHIIQVVDTSYDKINYKGDYDLVCITSMTHAITDAYKIADTFRKKGTLVILGGWHASALPEEAKEHADSVVVGEAEELWPQVLDDLKNKRLKPFYKQERPVAVEKIPLPRRDIYPKGTEIIIQASRGCPNGCEFCALSTMKQRTKYRTRPIKDIIYEIQSLKAKNFTFHDNSLTIDTNFSKNLFREMIGLNKSFSALGNINILSKDEEFLKLAKEAGCISWYIGFESISQSTIDKIGKKSNKVEDYITGIKKIHDHGMSIMGFFVFGNDEDTYETFVKTDEFLRLNEIEMPLFHILTPYPGTALFNRLEKEGRILTKDWSKYTESGNVVFQPKNMTPDELKEYTKEMYKNWYNFNANTNRALRSMRFGIDNFVLTIFHNAHIKNIIRLKY